MAKKMTKADLVEEVFRNTNLPKNEIIQITDSLLEEIKSALCKGSSIELRTFGTFELRLRKGRKNARNPRTGDITPTEPHYVAAFRSGSELKQKLWNLKI
jgi:integration host factor subunit beta